MRKFLSVLTSGAIAFSLTAATVGATTVDRSGQSCDGLSGLSKARCMRTKDMKAGKMMPALRVMKKKDVKINRPVRRALENTVKMREEKVRKAREAQASSMAKDKVMVCHKGETLTIGRSAEQAHIAHGDTKGACADTSSSTSSMSSSSSSSVSSAASSSSVSSAASSSSTSSN